MMLDVIRCGSHGTGILKKTTKPTIAPTTENGAHSLGGMIVIDMHCPRCRSNVQDFPANGTTLALSFEHGMILVQGQPIPAHE